jgi:hypothetical protein
MNESLSSVVRKLRLSGLARTLEVRLQEAASHNLNHLEFLELILQDELSVRQERLIDRRVKAAGFRELKPLTDFEWSFNPSIKKKQVFDLACCRCIRERRDVLWLGPPGVGKSFSVQALTGLRQGELMWLTKEDVDVARRLVRIRAKVFSKEGLRWDPKGDDRNVPLSVPALAIAKAMLASADGRWLFPAPPGPGVVDGRLRASRLWAHLKRAKKAAGVKRGTLTCLTISSYR